jgi:hypothetical protein
MATTDRQKGIGKSVIIVIETARFGISGDIRPHDFLSSERDRKSKDFAVSMVNAKDDPFAGCSPATFAKSFATKHRFINFNLTGERFEIFDHVLVNHFS